MLVMQEQRRLHAAWLANVGLMERSYTVHVEGRQAAIIYSKPCILGMAGEGLSCFKLRTHPFSGLQKPPCASTTALPTLLGWYTL